MSLIGIDVNSEYAVLVVTDGAGELLDEGPRTVKPAEDCDVSAQLGELRERVVQHLRAIGADRLVLTDSNLRRSSPSNIRSRSQIETIFYLAAHETGVAVEVVHQKKIAAHLGLAGNATKEGIRDAVQDAVGAAALSGDPARRARALGAVWVSAGVRMSG